MEVLIAEFEETDHFAIRDSDENDNHNHNHEGSESSYKDYEAAVSIIISLHLSLGHMGFCIVNLQLVLLMNNELFVSFLQMSWASLAWEIIRSILEVLIEVMM